MHEKVHSGTTLRCVLWYSPGDALNAILNYWVEELRMNYVALAIALG